MKTLSKPKKYIPIHKQIRIYLTEKYVTIKYTTRKSKYDWSVWSIKKYEYRRTHTGKEYIFMELE